MHPILFKLGPITIYSYGLMVALGFITATTLAANRAPRFNLKPDEISTLSLVILFFGLIGARICYCLLDIRYFLSNPVEILMVMHGGLVFYGGAIASFLSGLAYVRMRKLNAWDTLDLFAYYIPLGHAIGRIGCYLNGCCYGKPYHGIFAVTFGDGIPRIPTEILSSLLLFGLYFLLRAAFATRRFGGQVFFAYLSLYCAGRFLMEFLRGDNPPFLFGLTFSQIISAGLFIFAVTGYFQKSRNGQR